MGGHGDAACKGLHQPQCWMWIPGFHSRIVGPLKGNRWQSTAGARDGIGGWGVGAIVINTADAALCIASGQHSHFQKSPILSKSLQSFWTITASLLHHVACPKPLFLLHLTHHFISSSCFCFSLGGGGGIYLTHLLTSGKVFQFFSPHPLTPNPHHLCRVQQTSGTCFRGHSGRKPSLLWLQCAQD